MSVWRSAPRAPVRGGVGGYVARMRIAVLGPLEVSNDGRPVAVPGAKERLLLAVLTV